MQTEPFYVKNILELRTTKGDAYLVLDLVNQDKIRIRGVVWNPSTVVEYDEGTLKEDSCYIFDADEQEYKGEKQLNIAWAERIDVDRELFIDLKEIDLEDLKKRLFCVLGTVKAPAYRVILKNILALENWDVFNKLQTLPKTINYDYDYPGGLLLSTVYQVELADKVASLLLKKDDFDRFEESRDLLICAAFICDLGKIKEIDDASIKTDEGELLGHQYLGCLLLSEIDESTEFKYHEQITKLKHCVLVHHSTDFNNWTTIKIKLKEAELLRHITHMVFRSEEWEMKKR